MGPTVIDLFERSPTVCHFDDGSNRTAGDLASDGRQLAGWLLGQGLVGGDRVAVDLPNGADHVQLLLACAAAGLVAVPINARYTAEEVRDLVARSGARRVGPGDRWRSTDPVSRRGDAGDPFVVFTTSGTTSRPKMVLHRQRSIAVHARDVAAGFGYSPEDTVMVAMPLCGTFGLASLFGAVAGGCDVVVTNFDVAKTARLIAEHQVTAVNGSDDMFHRLLQHGADVSSIRLGGYARFNTSLDHVVHEAARAGATLTGLYGMSEVQALFSLRDPKLDVDGRARPGGTLVSAAAELRVVDGELQLRGPSLMAGYLAEGGDELDTELTNRHLDDGWFRTGDLADPEGPRSFEFGSRIGDAMRLGGFLVNPVEIETAIVARADVSAAQVVAVDRPGGARPVAFVVGEATEAEVIEWCRQRLAIHKVPIRVVVVDSFPTVDGANGTKIQRTKLREAASALLAEGR